MTYDAEQLLANQLNRDGVETSRWGRVQNSAYLVSEELGLVNLLTCSRDVYLIIFIRMIRLVAFHGIQLILIVYLKELDFDDRLVGLFMTLTFSGDLLTSFVLSIVADNVGRKNIFMLSSFIMLCTGVAFLFIKDHILLIVIAFIGIMTPGGDVGPFKSLESSSLASLVPYEKRSDIYAWYGFLAKCFASLGIMGAGYLVLFAQHRFGLDVVDAYRTVFVTYIVISAMMFITAMLLSPAVEWQSSEYDHATHKSSPQEVLEADSSHITVEEEYQEEQEEPDESDKETQEDILHMVQDSENSTSIETAAQISRKDSMSEVTPLLPISRTHQQSSTNPSHSSTSTNTNSDVFSMTSKTSNRAKVKESIKKIKSIRILPRLSRDSYITVIKLSLLFGLDSFASSFIGGSWQAYYILHKFKVQPAEVGSIFFVTGIIAGFMSLLGSTLCKRIGPILTMVVTHLPASILCAILPLAPTLRLTFILLVVRSCVQAMDAAPKQVFLSAIVPPNERTSVIGWVNVVKTLSHTLGPSVAGVFLSWDKQWMCFVFAGVLKVAYDLGIMVTFMEMNRDHHIH
ncbi:hypothetical protein CAAN1_15S00496 [[Candida] anglica]|uniref:Major facilitator superfamily (MFS) profile domain-containing protein n=1 Tax=[Candida] anglica TaxID=148631 RepID=A0ABP0E7T7_9ASCO